MLLLFERKITEFSCHKKNKKSDIYFAW